MIVWLTGFMGAGKTTTGRRLARLLNVPFFDTDAEIEREHGPIAELFQSRGEASFRAIEAALIARCAAGGEAVVAVGGGGAVSAANRAAMRTSGAVVHLAISSRGAFSRVAHRKHRPLLGPQPDLEQIESLMDQRRDAYADNDFRLRVDGKSPATVAHIIARWCVRRRLPARGAADAR